MSIQRQLPLTNSGKKFECHETTVSLSRPATSAIFLITNKTKTSVGGQMIRHNSIPALQTKKDITNSEVKGGE